MPLRLLVWCCASLLLGLTALTAAPRAAAAECRFVLGFATLRDAVPDVVGSCLDDVTYNPQNGDALQHTWRSDGSPGLLVWRRADNYTAFTDGGQTWVNGPMGLQTRLNTQRLNWEPNPERLPLTPAPLSGQQCHTAGLTISNDRPDIGAGNIYVTFHFTNELNVTCTFYGFPGALLRDASGNALPTNAQWGGGAMAREPSPTLIRVAPQGLATFKMHWEQVPVGNETVCPAAAQLDITPPDEFAPLTIPITVRACGGGRLDISAIQP